ncbi:MAG: acyl-CoA dehydrogenase [Gammaproteobacteria bacterium]|nr:acyl-CoA dehydrogenase [Gammaproteobacteria bacterium]
MTLIGMLFLLVLVWVLAYQAVSPLVWMVLIPVILTSFHVAGLLPLFVTLPIWVIYSIALFFYVLPTVRGRWIIAPLLSQFRRVMPAMSQTEREALDAGNVWWDGELFSGRPDWNRLLHHPASRLSEREQAYLDGPVEALCSRLNDWQVTHHQQDLPEEIWDYIKRSGMFGMIIPESWGGLGFSAAAHSSIVMKLASRSVAAAVTVMVPNSLGPAKLLLHYGTEQQKAAYLPSLAKGDEIPCFALTGPHAGSDAGAMPDRGEVCYQRHQGRSTLGIRLNWNKRYITLAPVATLIGLAFKLYDPEHVLGKSTSLGITLALIPRDTPGVEIGQRHMPLNIPFQNGPIRGKDVFIPLSSVIGGKAGIGQGWRMLVECLAEGRGISLPALATGAGKLACRYTGAYAGIRRQFGRPIGQFEGIEEALARIAGLTYQMDAARLLTLSALDQGEKPSVISAIIKYHLTERYRQVIQDAMDIQGGSGICLGPSNPLGRIYQAIPIAITVEGANILTRNMIIFGQGSIRCHPYILDEFEAAAQTDPEQGVKAFDASLFGHVGYLLTNLARSFWLGLTYGKFSASPRAGITKGYFRRLNWMSSAFALTVDLSLMTLGGALKRKERISARLGDLLSELYIASAVIKRFLDQGEPDALKPLFHWAMQDSLHRLQQAQIGLFRNMPNRLLAWLLRIWVFPLGLPFHKPSDRLDHEVSGRLLKPGKARDQLTEHIFISKERSDRTGLLEQALAKVTAAVPIEKTLLTARKSGHLSTDDPSLLQEEALRIGILSREDLQVLEQAEQLRDRVIQVDAFPDLASKTDRITGHGSSPDFPFGHLGAA